MHADDHRIDEPRDSGIQSPLRLLALLLVAPCLLDLQHLHVGLAVGRHIALLNGLDQRPDDRVGVMEVSYGLEIVAGGP